MAIDYSLSLNIGGVGVKIETKLKKVYEYMLQEFYIFSINSMNISTYPLELNIQQSKFILPKKHKKINSTSYSFGDRILHKIPALGRKTWISCQSLGNNHLKIDIYLSCKVIDSKIEKFFSGSFQSKWQSCLVDFFHGLFLGLLEIELLKKGNTFLHASAFCTKEGKTIVLAGHSQSGKSSFVDALTQGSKGRIISEDFCIIKNDGTLISYPKNSRVYKKQIDKTSYYLHKRPWELIIDKLNFFIFTPAKIIGFEPKRRLNLKELFPGRNFLSKAKLDFVVFLVRNGNSLTTLQHQGVQFVDLCIESMLIEMNNLTGFDDFLFALTNVFSLRISKDSIINDMRFIINEACHNVNCCIVKMPFYSTQDLANSKLEIALNCFEKRKHEY